MDYKKRQSCTMLYLEIKTMLVMRGWEEDPPVWIFFIEIEIVYNAMFNFE